MSEHTNIEWTDATWNPITGCSVISPGCIRCYAMKLAGTRMKNHPSRSGLTRESKTGPVWTGEVRFNEEWLTQPLSWKRPRTIFVCAHGDLFHESVPDEWIDRVFAVMALAPQHRFQVLTKRNARMRAYCTALDLRRLVDTAPDDVPLKDGVHCITLRLPLPNIWLGVSAEDQTRADERIPDLLATPAAVRFVSLEPLLGPIDLTAIKLKGIVDPFDAFAGATWSRPPSLNGARFFSHIMERKDRAKLDWAIVGGESGPNARPMHPDWARKIRDDCEAAGVPFFFKQWGEWAPAPRKLERLQSETVDDYKSRSEALAATHGFAPWEPWDHINLLSHKPWSIERASQKPRDHEGMHRPGKRAAGRLLDGRTWDEMPEQRQHRQAGSNPASAFDTATT